MIVEGKDALVLGGTVHAIQGIEIAEVGNEMEVNTVLSAGVLNKTLVRDRELVTLIDEVKEQLEVLSNAVKRMENLTPDNMPEDAEEQRMKIVQAKVIKSVEYKRLQDEKAKIEALVRSGKDAQIIIQKVIQPGCRVEIAGMSMQVRETLKHVKFVVRDGRIEASLLY